MQPPLIVRLACGSRGRRAVIVFACYVSFLLLPPPFHRCSSIAPLTATSFQPKGEFVCAPSFRSVLSVTLQSLHYIHSLRQTLLRTPQKKLHSTQKLRQHSWAVIALIFASRFFLLARHSQIPQATFASALAAFVSSLRYIPCSLPAALAQLASASPYTSAAGKALRYRYAAFPPPSLLKAVFPALFSAVSASNFNLRLYKNDRFFSLSLLTSITDKTTISTRHIYHINPIRNFKISKTSITSPEVFKVLRFSPRFNTARLKKTKKKIRADTCDTWKINISVNS